MSHVRHTGRAVEPAVITERPILVQCPCANPRRLSGSQVAEPHNGDEATKRAHKRSFAELSVELFESCTPRGASEGATEAPVTPGLMEVLEIQGAPPIALSQNGVGR